MNKKLYKLMNWPKIEEIVYAESDNPHELLGAHVYGSNVCVQCYFPEAVSVKISYFEEDVTKKITMEMADEAGYFAVLLPRKTVPIYQYEVEYKEGNVIACKDPYRYEPLITKEDAKKFNKGIHYNAYDILGAHPISLDWEKGTYFAVWAPNALRVSVVGDFNQWDGRTHQMRRLWDSGIFELFVPEVGEGEIYKYEIKAKGGKTYMKADPYGFGAQLRPETASIVRNINKFKWSDTAWMDIRSERVKNQEPMSVYELYLASFKKPTDGREYYTYKELAPMVIDYVKRMGYTHVELMPVMEHPLDASWGYQVIGYYAPTARYGTAQDFMCFVDALHRAQIGVILDWVPAHFPRDVQGLAEFDGTCLYEHADPRKGAHPDWGTLIYNYGRPEVTNYLIANALYWIQKYHVDGLRMDAVASMLYLDYGKRDGEWVANMYGGNENLEAVEFIKHLNSVLHKTCPGAITIAEESTAWPLITGSLEEGGLGFDYKWNMGWMNDYLGYIQYDPYFRVHHHGELTFSMIYAYSEKYMLVLSHDEVVHGKSSLIGKMPGEIPEKFSNLKLTYAYMMTHPGKKLLFMGQDIGEFKEFSESREVEWDLLQDEKHKKLNDLVADLNAFYKNQPALYALDEEPEGFEWINSISANENVLVYVRKTDKEAESLLVVANFSNLQRNQYKIGVPFGGKYKEILNTDGKKYGGNGVANSRVKVSREDECDERENSIQITIPALSLLVFSCTPFTEKEKKEIEKKKEEERLKEEELALKAQHEEIERQARELKSKEEAIKEKEAALLKEKARLAREQEKIKETAVKQKTRKTPVKKTTRKKVN